MPAAAILSPSGLIYAVTSESEVTRGRCKILKVSSSILLHIWMVLFATVIKRLPLKLYETELTLAFTFESNVGKVYA